MDVVMNCIDGCFVSLRVLSVCVKYNLFLFTIIIDYLCSDKNRTILVACSFASAAAKGVCRSSRCMQIGRYIMGQTTQDLRKQKAQTADSSVHLFGMPLRTICLIKSDG